LKHAEGALRISLLTPEAKAKLNGDGAKAQGDSHGHWEGRVFSTFYACPACKRNLAELEPRTFSFNSPHGACRTCDGFGVVEGFDPELVLPDLSLSLGGGAVAPWPAAAGPSKDEQQKLPGLFLNKAKLA